MRIERRGALEQPQRAAVLCVIVIVLFAEQLKNENKHKDAGRNDKQNFRRVFHENTYGDKIPAYRLPMRPRLPIGIPIRPKLRERGGEPLHRRGRHLRDGRRDGIGKAAQRTEIVRN